MNVENLGQIFTPAATVSEMVALIQNHGKILEPSAGSGNFLRELPPETDTCEIDPSLTDQPRDFFTITDHYDTIIGNPPYVRYQDIIPSTRELLPAGYDKRTNLYTFFIDRAIDLLNPNGELIFIVPRDFIKTTSARPLNARLFNEGGFTHWDEKGDQQIFADASPNVVIFRWVKGGNHSIKVSLVDNFLTFGETKGYQIKDRFDILVGGASGANGIFINPAGNIDLVNSKTKATGETVRAFYVDAPNDYLLNHKTELLARKIKKFNENNWFEWGRKIRHIDGAKIYVNNKTRDLKPFFTNESGWFDGSILALVPKEEVDIEAEIERLNNNDWNAQGFLVGGRLVFGQRSLLSAWVS